ncbi:hypothetical protein [Labilibacter marinus]|uniref:hypothetical protein n=1 Tax=Labilibacter marinus TaxID=1477105 RepID=UPI0008340FFA|nr:hypothetical protein [Labilibacter marinus]
MVDNIEIMLKSGSSDGSILSALKCIGKIALPWDKIRVSSHIFEVDSVYFEDIDLAIEYLIKNLDSDFSIIHCSHSKNGEKEISLLFRELEKKEIYIQFVNKAPNFTLEQFHYYEQFFYNIYQSLDSKIYYKSFVGVASKNKFYRENGLLDINFYNAPFIEESFFYRCLTPKSAYGKWHTKEQLLQAPFYSIKELDDEVLEIIQFEQPIDITNKQHIENMRSLQSYLSQHNTYPEDL